MRSGEKGWVQRHVCCGWDSRRHLLASADDIIYTNMDIPGVTDNLQDEVNLIHLKIILAIGSMTRMLTVGFHTKCIC